MFKRVLLATALLSGAASAQHNADISEADFNSGAANAQLAALGSQAAASGKRLIVTAPQHWHAKISAAIRSGGAADVVLKDGFYETVLVRVEDKPEPEPVKPVAPPKEEAKPVAPPAPAVPAPVSAPAKPVVEAAVAPTPPATPVAEMKAEPEAPAVVDEKAAEPAAEPVGGEPKSASFDPATFVGAEPGDVDPVRRSLEKQYNEGKRINERFVAKDLRNGDLIYVRGSAAVVVRREGKRLLRFWLEGPVDLTQSGIEADGGNKYRVLSPRVR
jgi:hypothetical protein